MDIKMANLLKNPDYFARFFSLGIITQESSIHTFAKNKRFDTHLIGLIRDFYQECPKNCECKKIIDYIQEKINGKYHYRIPITTHVEEKLVKAEKQIQIRVLPMAFHIRVENPENCEYKFCVNGIEWKTNEILFFPGACLQFCSLELWVTPLCVPYKLTLKYDHIVLDNTFNSFHTNFNPIFRIGNKNYLPTEGMYQETDEKPEYIDFIPKQKANCVITRFVNGMVGIF